MSKPLVGIIMGSQSDLKVMRLAADLLEESAGRLIVEEEGTWIS